MKVFKRILAEVFKAKKTVLFLVSLLVVASAFDVAMPFIAQNLIDKLVNAFALKQAIPMTIVIIAAVGIFAVTTIANALNMIYDYKLFTFVTKLEDELRFRAYQKYLSLHALYHHETNSVKLSAELIAAQEVFMKF